MSKLSAILLILPLSIQANEYHFDSNLAYTRLETDLVDTNAWQTSLNYYWDPITHSNLYPNKEMAFVNRLGSLGIQYVGALSSNDPFYFDLDILANGVAVDFTYANNNSNHVFTLDYGWINTDIEVNYGGLRFKQELNAHNFGLGYQYYLLDNLTVGGKFSAEFVDDSFNKSSELYTYSLHSKYLLDFGHENWLAVNGGYSYFDDKDNYAVSFHHFNLSAEYYFNPITSIQLQGRATFTEFFEDSYYDSEFIGVSAHHYFTDQFSIDLSFNHTFKKDDEPYQYSFGMNYLF